jgi:hypothetical protein
MWTILYQCLVLLVSNVLTLKKEKRKRKKKELFENCSEGDGLSNFLLVNFE